MAKLHILRQGPWEGRAAAGLAGLPDSACPQELAEERAWAGPATWSPFFAQPDPVQAEVGFQAMSFSFSGPREDTEVGETMWGSLPPPEKARSCVLSLSLILSRLEALRGPSITPGASRIKKGHWRFLNMDQKAVKCVLKKKSRH